MTPTLAAEKLENSVNSLILQVWRLQNFYSSSWVIFQIQIGFLIIFGPLGCWLDDHDKLLVFFMKFSKPRVFFAKDIGDLGGGFRYFLFSPLFEDDSHFDQYFSDGLKPPTRDVRQFCTFPWIEPWHLSWREVLGARRKDSQRSFAGGPTRQGEFSISSDFYFMGMQGYTPVN